MNTTLNQVKKASGRVVLALGLVLGAMVAGAPFAKAGTTSSGDVYANIPEVADITFTPTHNNSGTAIALTPNTALSSTSIGKVNVKSNWSGGFTVTLASTNLGQLKNGTNVINYTLSYDGSSKGQPGAATEMEKPTALVAAAAGASGADRDVQIAIAQSEVNNKPAGDYADTLTFTIANNH